MLTRYRFSDNTKISFEAAVRRLGERGARRAFSMALNREGRSARTRLRRVLMAQTSIKSPDISRALSFRPAKPGKLRIEITGRGRPLPLSYFGAKQFRYGVRARVWGNAQRFPGAFLVASLGNAYVRLGAARLPIRGMFGPSIPREMLRDEALEAVEGIDPKVLAEARRQVTRLLAGA